MPTCLEKLQEQSVYTYLPRLLSSYTVLLVFFFFFSLAGGEHHRWGMSQGRIHVWFQNFPIEMLHWWIASLLWKIQNPTEQWVSVMSFPFWPEATGVKLHGNCKEILSLLLNMYYSVIFWLKELWMQVTIPSFQSVQQRGTFSVSRVRL